MKMEVGEVLELTAVDDQPVTTLLQVKICYQGLDRGEKVGQEERIANRVKRCQTGDNTPGH